MEVTKAPKGMRVKLGAWIDKYRDWSQGFVIGDWIMVNGY
jgi:hypothetical protein